MHVHLRKKTVQGTKRGANDFWRLNLRTNACRVADILGTVTQDARGRRGSFLDRLKSDDALLRKWCMNLTALLVLTGGGQRPQAYDTLQVPSGRERQKDIETDFGVFFSMRTNLNEKNNRNLSFPVVLFPNDFLKFVDFHVDHILPYLRATFELCQEVEDNRLLYHTEDGGGLSASSITRTVRAFLKNMEPKLGHLNTTYLRSYYATSMIHAFRNRKMGDNNSKQRFLELSANRMNTSAEQLRGAYT
ncbi:hypothetical protein FGB62_260g02 [Gracilaria domingensis]|nr:hypothetical protein FGB62_260g02 [Gracilaria domingensis]